MADIIRITGLNTIDFLGTAYPLGREPGTIEGMNIILQRRRVVSYLNRLPREIWEQMLELGLSVIVIHCDIVATTDTLLESYLDALVDTLESTKDKWGGGSGTYAYFQYKLDGYATTNQKKVWWGQADDSEARLNIGGLKAHQLINVKITLYCEEKWGGTKITPY